MGGKEHLWAPVVRGFCVLFLMAHGYQALLALAAGKASFGAVDLAICGGVILLALVMDADVLRALWRKWRQRNQPTAREAQLNRAKGFVIPDEFRDLPEAVEVRRLEAAFARACEVEHEALKAGLLESAPDYFNAVSAETSTLQVYLKEAREAFDNATGEPRPLPLPPDLEEAITSQFSKEDGERVSMILAKTLAHLDRYRLESARVAHGILKLSRGDVAAVEECAAQAWIDWRDIIVAADGMQMAKKTTGSDHVQENQKGNGRRRRTVPEDPAQRKGIFHAHGDHADRRGHFLS